MCACSMCSFAVSAWQQTKAAFMTASLAVALIIAWHATVPRQRRAKKVVTLSDMVLHQMTWSDRIINFCPYQCTFSARDLTEMTLLFPAPDSTVLTHVWLCSRSQDTDQPWPEIPLPNT